jgi:hypothetical protein
VRAHLSLVPSACALDCNMPHKRKELAAGASHRELPLDPGIRGAMIRSTVQHSHLPWRSRRDRSVADTHRPHPRREDMSVGTVVVAHQVGWRRGPGKRLGNLTGQPLGCRMPRHLEPQQLSPAVTQNEECKQEIKGQRRHNAHIDGGDGLSLVSQKCSGVFGGLQQRARKLATGWLWRQSSANASRAGEFPC